jgi:hypothetical protein
MCTKCGATDGRQSWSSSEQASREGALDAWTCPACAWPEAELVDLDETRQESVAR